MIIRLITLFLLSESIVLSGYCNSIHTEDSIPITYYDAFHTVNTWNPEEPEIVLIEFNFQEFFKNKHTDEQIPARLSVYDEDSLLNIREIKLQPRGNFRRNHCSFPPLKLDFKMSDSNTVFLKDVNKIKLVTHCRQSGKYEQYVLKEYLCYKIYNFLTDLSFRVHLLEIEYIDTGGKYEPFTKFGFLIESEEGLIKRLDVYPAKQWNISKKEIDLFNFHLMSVFQFMIGNNDWIISALHNIRLYQQKDIAGNNLVAVPYDFDYSGMVNAQYAIPDESLGIKTVRQRLYHGYCIPENDFIPVFSQFLVKKDGIFDIINNFRFLDKRHKTEMLKYTNDFYRIIEEPKLVKKSILDDCKKYGD